MSVKKMAIQIYLQVDEMNNEQNLKKIAAICP